MKKLMVVGTLFLVQLNSFAGQSDLTRALGEFHGQLQLLKGVVAAQEEELEKLESAVLKKLQFVLNTPVQDLQANLAAKSVHETIEHAFPQAIQLLVRWGAKVVEAVKADKRVTEIEKTKIEQWMKELEKVNEGKGLKIAALQAAYASPAHGQAQLLTSYHSVDESITRALDCYDHITSIATSLFTQGWPSPIEQPNWSESFSPGALLAKYPSGTDIKPLARMTNLLTLSQRKPENILKAALS